MWRPSVPFTKPRAAGWHELSSDLLLEALLRLSDDQIYFKDTESRFLRVSSGIADRVGVSREDLIGKNDVDVADQESAEKYRADDRKVMDSRAASVDIEEEQIWPDGRTTWASTSKWPVEQDDGTVVGLVGVTRDITARKAAEDALTAANQALVRFGVVYAEAPVGMATIGLDGTVSDPNPALCRLLGRADEELIGVRVTVLVDGDDVLRCALEGLLAGEQDHHAGESRLARTDGVAVWTHLTCSLVRGNAGRPEFGILMVEDITARKSAEDELRRHAELSEYQALHDGLTGLPNRTLFADRVQQELHHANRDGGRLAVMLLDLDRFKEINDTLGHASGDHVLQVVAERLAGCLRASDTVARLGGDEFGLLLPKQNETADVEQLLKKLSAALADPIDLEGLPLGIEGSIGVAFYPDHGATTGDLMKRADVAMYRAKQQNEPYAFYEHDADHHDPLRLSLVGDLRKAIDERQLVLHYQPKATLAGAEVCSVEALLRWFHPERGLIAPDDFIPQAQETGLMKPLTFYVIEEALRQIKEWRTEGVDLCVSVNVGTRNLIDIAFPDDVAAVLARYDVEPGSLEIEITESTMLEDPFRTKIVLERLHAMGIRLSIDDFGTGYSSLAYLRDLPVSEIKIDRSFVLNMHENDDDAMIVRSTIDLGRNLGLRVVAEGVESAETWHRLADLGCDLAQGYVLAKPMPPHEMREWLSEASSAVDGTQAALCRRVA
jgi:diguanylate cyclase (GGDEF)-like protein/PAS domain S-box-containing protein